MAYYETNMQRLLAGPTGDRDHEYRHAADIFNVCQGLHMSCFGAADPMPDAEASACYHWLTWRLEHWHHLNPSIAYSEAVRAMILATLAEVGLPQSVYDNHAVVYAKPWGK